MSGPPVMKKPKLEINEEEEEEEDDDDENENETIEEQIRSDQEEALVALIEHRTKEVEHLRQRITYYKSQLDEAETRLEETQIKLARLRGRGKIMASKTSLGNGMKEVKFEKRSTSPIQVSKGSSQGQSQFTPHLGEEAMKSAGYYLKVARKPTSPSYKNEDSSQNQTKSKPQLVIPSADTLQHAMMKESGNEVPSGSGSWSSAPIPPHVNIPQLVIPSADTLQRERMKESGNEVLSGSGSWSSAPIPPHVNIPQLVIPSADTLQRAKMKESGNEVPSGSGSWSSAPIPPHVNSMVKFKKNKARGILSEHHTVETLPEGTKRNLEQKERKELIPLISSCSSPHSIRCQTGFPLSSQHKRKLRSLVLCPTNDQLFVTSALDGMVNLWQVRDRGSSANLLSTADCRSSKRRWPEDIAWHPQGNSLFSVYSADSGDSQISILNLNQGKEKLRVTFLEGKPHIKGIINSIIFMPCDDTCFVTGGSDHAVVLWTEKDGEHSWKPEALHKSIHSSSVMGVAGMQHKKVVMSVGADKRIIGFDLLAERVEYKNQIDSKCMSVLPNPCDFNLFMVQTGTPERQLRLFDVRERQKVIHTFGWKQESSESQSALINQTWSPDGLYLTSGSADPVIHIFDIRYNAHKPFQSLRAHQKRVFKAAWHHSLPLLISISSDLNIGLHKITSF
ncbi:U5 small nuclear ribonucleoprotein 40 kDa protein [Forsythia ovata]|uniref:U5 small nuclear ribonucleoprotein 40 kDa protein n=1 Tax=Forsythia ovata TaxID=205694 RepID=A0ABD1WYP6_9LAMI